MLSDLTTLDTPQKNTKYNIQKYKNTKIQKYVTNNWSMQMCLWGTTTEEAEIYSIFPFSVP